MDAPAPAMGKRSPTQHSCSSPATVLAAGLRPQDARPEAPLWPLDPRQRAAEPPSSSSRGGGPPNARSSARRPAGPVVAGRRRLPEPVPRAHCQRLPERPALLLGLVRPARPAAAPSQAVTLGALPARPAGPGLRHRHHQQAPAYSRRALPVRRHRRAGPQQPHAGGHPAQGSVGRPEADRAAPAGVRRRPDRRPTAQRHGTRLGLPRALSRDRPTPPPQRGHVQPP